MQLVTHTGEEETWSSSFSGFGTTNWSNKDKSQGGIDSFLPTTTGGGDMYDETQVFAAQAYNSYIGNSANLNWESNGDLPGRKSGMDLGYTSYFMQKDVELGDNQFFIGSPKGVNYYLPGCPNYEPGETSAASNYECPRIPVAAGTFKFTILGLMSGSMINSLNSVTPARTDQGTFEDNQSVEKDIAAYKTMRYRSTLDLGMMGGDIGNYTTMIVGGDHDGKSFEDLTPDDDVSGAVLRITGSKKGDIDVIFSDRYSTGTYTRSRSDLLDEFGGCQEEEGNTMDLCTRDLTGFKECSSGYCTDSLPSEANKAVRKAGDSSMPREELGKLAGAPDLKVTEVKHMKITMRPSNGCERPDIPVAEDSTGTRGLSWPSPDASDCPWWMLATGHSEGGSVDWAVGNADHLGKTQVSDMTLCKKGSCWLIDFHIELGGQTEASRTVFGNPENAIEYGWETGTFFLYDPEAIGTGPDFVAQLDWPIIAAMGGGLLVIIILLISCCCFCKKKCCGGKNGIHEENVKGVQLT